MPENVSTGSMKPEELLPENHPSRNAGSAVFIFRTMTQRNNLVFVSAVDAWQVVILERITSKDNYVNNSMALVAVIRDPSGFGIRDQAIEVPLYEFLRDCVDPYRILEDSETRYALTKTFGESVPEATSHDETDLDRSTHSNDQSDIDKAISVLSGLGFKDAQIKQVLKLHVKDASNIPNLVRSAYKLLERA